MAQKRMFDKSITNSDNFRAMPATTQNLYFHLSMNADDDGFLNDWKGIMKILGSSEDDIKLLVAKSYVIPFESGVIVIKHWRINNFLRKDRHIATKCQKEASMLNVTEEGEYSLENGDNTKLITFYEDSEETSNYKELRKIAYEESTLPYSFEYKIKQAFVDKECPICGYKMANYEGSPHKPTIQHNLPISKGGKHELGNISVICHQCNVSIRDNETNELNAREVIDKWDEICGQPNIGQPSKEKISKEKNNIYINTCSNEPTTNFTNEELFIAFWSAYPKKKNKGSAEKWFKSHKPTKELVDTMIEKIEQQKNSKDWLKNDGQFIPYPSTWLNAKAWEDETIEKSNVPSWFNKEIEQETASDEDRLEIEEFLKEYR